VLKRSLARDGGAGWVQMGSGRGWSAGSNAGTNYQCCMCCGDVAESRMTPYSDPMTHPPRHQPAAPAPALHLAHPEVAVDVGLGKARA
jgi:hypothetical protein